MAEKIKNLEILSPAQNPRHPHKRGYLTDDAHTHTEALPRSQPSSKQALSRPHNSCKHTLSRLHTLCTNTLPRSTPSSRSPNTCREPRPRFQTTSSISLSRPRLIKFPSQSSHNSTIPLEVSQEIRTWLQRCGLGGYLLVIDAPPHPEA